MAKNRQLEYKFRKQKENCKELKRQMEENKCVSTVENLVSKAQKKKTKETPKSKFIMILNILKFCRESEAYYSSM